MNCKHCSAEIQYFRIIVLEEHIYTAYPVRLRGTEPGSDLVMIQWNDKGSVDESEHYFNITCPECDGFYAKVFSPLQVKEYLVKHFPIPEEPECFGWIDNLDVEASHSEDGCEACHLSTECRADQELRKQEEASESEYVWANPPCDHCGGAILDVTTGCCRKCGATLVSE